MVDMTAMNEFETSLPTTAFYFATQEGRKEGDGKGVSI